MVRGDLALSYNLVSPARAGLALQQYLEVVPVSFRFIGDRVANAARGADDRNSVFLFLSGLTARGAPDAPAAVARRSKRTSF
jgi:hypothetical protein